MHVYHVESGKPVAVLLRPGKTPSGVEVRTLLKHLVRRIRRHWPRTRLTFRGDRHYGRAEAMAWCEDNGVDYIFGLAGNQVLHRFAYDVADDLKVRRAEAGAEKMRSFDAFDYAAGPLEQVPEPDRAWNKRLRTRASWRCKIPSRLSTTCVCVSTFAQSQLLGGASMQQDLLDLKEMGLTGGVLNIADRGPSVDSADPSVAQARFDSARGRTVIMKRRMSW